MEKRYWSAFWEGLSNYNVWLEAGVTDRLWELEDLIRLTES